MHHGGVSRAQKSEVHTRPSHGGRRIRVNWLLAQSREVEMEWCAVNPYEDESKTEGKEKNLQTFCNDLYVSISTHGTPRAIGGIPTLSRSGYLARE